MTCTPLPNYLRAHRKRCGLSQAEAAFLAGCSGAAKICGYERGRRPPALRVAIALELIYDAPLAKLFAGLYAEVARDLAGRKRELARRWFAPNEGERQDVVPGSGRLSKSHNP